MRKFILTSVVVVTSLLSLSAQAKMYKWVDNQGVTHYGETIPAEYADKDRAEMSKSGRIIKQTEIATPAERQARAAQAEKDKEAADADRASKLRDKSLLNTYSNVKEIELSRQRNTQQVDIRIESTSKQLAEANKAFAQVQKLIDSKSRAKQAIDAYTQEDWNDAQAEVTKWTAKLEGFKQDKARLETKFAADLARYKELTGK
jgi:Domain of unknown function (DUF4124)